MYLNAYFYKINLIQMKKYFFLIAIPVIFSAACKKSNSNDSINIPVVDSALLVSQELTLDSNNTLTQMRTFTYDSHNRMTLQYTKRPGAFSSSATYTYDSNGNLITSILLDTSYNNSTISSTSATTWNFVYTNNIPVSATQQNGGSSTTNYTFTAADNQITGLFANNVLYAQYSYTGSNLVTEIDYFGTNTVTYSETYNIGKSAFYLSGYKWNLPDDIIPLGGQNQATTYGIPNAYIDIYSVTSFNTSYPKAILETSSLTNTKSTLQYKYILPK